MSPPLYNYSPKESPFPVAIKLLFPTSPKHFNHYTGANLQVAVGGERQRQRQEALAETQP